MLKEIYRRKHMFKNLYGPTRMFKELYRRKHMF